ncbi:MAG: single-stranded-DNA-specific exonuclease RecJ [Oscillospiraceae bacterium]|nr:single-stranded-DNA-specific exonuclease RecJ [Oscillospiraceae bacterium]
MKYEVWNVGKYDPARLRELCAAGYSPLTAAVLCSRGFDTPAKAQEYLAADKPMCDPFTMLDMDKVTARLRLALTRGETIAVFGDHDVDGITSTCLLTDLLRSLGARVIPYIPERLEEGYGLNELAIRGLLAQGVRLIVTVDCGITANVEAALCRDLGIDLVVTDHHECKEALPDAVGVIDPHRRDETYPHKTLAGVGVAFKLAEALTRDPEGMLDRYSDLVCLGTVADVVPLQGENRTIVVNGLKKLSTRPRVGIRALLEECGCLEQPVTASLIGYTLAPRLNAAGRMGDVSVALELLLENDAERAAKLARRLCEMNVERQTVESAIYQDAVSRLPDRSSRPAAIVLADEQWHQGVVGIVASRLAEEYGCPTFLICLDGDKGKASSRSYGGFNLFGALTELSPHLENFGGHELAAGFTISRDRIDGFRQEMLRLADAHRALGESRTVLNVDCAVTAEQLSIKNVDALEELEPCGCNCPKPVFALRGVQIEQLSAVGGGKHLRLRLRQNGTILQSIFFSASAARLGIAEGDVIDVAFTPSVNEYRGMRNVQLGLTDLRPGTAAPGDELTQYSLFHNGKLPDAQMTRATPCRRDFVALWKYMQAHAQNGTLEETLTSLAKNAARAAGLTCSVLRTGVCLDIFEELDLIAAERNGERFRIRLRDNGKKVDLDSSRIFAGLKQIQIGSNHNGR